MDTGATTVAVIAGFFLFLVILVGIYQCGGNAVCDDVCGPYEHRSAAPADCRCKDSDGEWYDPFPADPSP